MIKVDAYSTFCSYVYCIPIMDHILLSIYWWCGLSCLKLMLWFIFLSLPIISFYYFIATTVILSARVLELNSEYLAFFHVREIVY